MTTYLTEDDIYRTSTQYRLWSFTPESLAALREQTHAAAIERAKKYLGHGNGTTGHSDGANGNGEGDGTVADCLTAEEELRLVQRYADQIRTTSDFFKWPVNVKATAVQYLHRFYLSNSTLTYPPRETYKCALFLASKTEGVHMTLSEYARRISTDAQLILAPEYKIIQALRFTLDVRQPFRGLKGALMELLNIAAGRGAVPQHSRTGKTGAELQTLMAELPGVADGDRSTWAAPAGAAAADPRVLADRAHVAYGVARQILDAPALLTDVYFLFTTPQIYFGALMLADSVLAGFYLSTKLALESPVRGKVLATIGACRDMLGAWSPQGVMSKEERAGLEAKLERCRDPTTRDLVGAMAAEKRGGGDEGALDDGVAKRRKLEREKSMKEGEDLFGPSLPTVGNAA